MRKPLLYVLLAVLLIAWKWGKAMGKPNRAWLEKRITYERSEQRRRTRQHRHTEAAERGALIDELLERWQTAERSES